MNAYERRCPACKDPRLALKADRGAAYSVCPDCAGLFVGESQLYKYIEAVTQDIGAAQAFVSLLEDALARDAPDGSHLRACPVCRADLERFGFGEHPMSIADRCPQGHGLWLDDGDLSKVIRCSRAIATVDGRRPKRGTQTYVAAEANPMVCPNCSRRFPETDADARCDDCNVALFRG